MPQTISGAFCTSLQHFAQHVGGGQAAAHQLHHLAHEQQLLGVPVGGRVAGVGGAALGRHDLAPASKHRTSAADGDGGG